jgi:hypothetical protein
MRNIKAGTLFAVPVLEGSFLFGRLMLNSAYCRKKRLLPEGSPIAGLGGECLVEMYRGISTSLEYAPSPVLLPGAWLWPDNIGRSWPIIGFEDVRCLDVEFPEALIIHPHADGEAAFTCGEIFIPLPLSHQDVDAIGVYRTVHPQVTWGYVCLALMGRQDAIPVDWQNAVGLADTDLRFSTHRDQIYQYLPFDKNLSYFEKQAQLGHRLQRFYMY